MPLVGATGWFLLFLAQAFVWDATLCNKPFLHFFNKCLHTTCRLDALRKGMAESADRCRKLEREYQWIPSEKAQFGRPGSDYDWEAHNADRASGQPLGN